MGRGDGDHAPQDAVGSFDGKAMAIASIDGLGLPVDADEHEEPPLASPFLLVGNQRGHHCHIGDRAIGEGHLPAMAGAFGSLFASSLEYPGRSVPFAVSWFCPIWFVDDFFLSPFNHQTGLLIVSLLPIHAKS